MRRGYLSSAARRGVAPATGTAGSRSRSGSAVRTGAPFRRPDLSHAPGLARRTYGLYDGLWLEGVHFMVSRPMNEVDHTTAELSERTSLVSGQGQHHALKVFDAHMH